MTKNMRWGFTFAGLSVFTHAFYVVLGQPLFAIISPLTFAFVENAAALIILVCAYGVFPEYKKLQHLSREHLLGIFLFAFLSSVVAPYLFYSGWSLSTPNNTFLLAQGEMIFTVLLATWFLHEKMTLQRTLGVLLMFAGVYLIASEGGKHFFNFGTGELLILLSGLVWALGSIVFKKYGGKPSMELVLLLRFFFGTLVFAIALFSLESQHLLFLQHFTFHDFLLLAGYSIFAVIFSKYFWLRSVAVAPLFVYSTLALASPVLGLLMNYLFLHEVPALYHYLGGLLIILGFIVLQIHVRKIQMAQHLHILHDDIQT